MSASWVFVQRDGALLVPAPGPMHASEPKWIDEAIPALWLLCRSGYALVLIDTPAIARPARVPCDPAQARLTEQVLALARSQGAAFTKVLSCVHGLTESCTCPPGALRLTSLLTEPYDRQRSVLVAGTTGGSGLAEALGVRELLLDDGHGSSSWLELATGLVESPRVGRVARETKETKVSIELNLDRAADAKITTGIGFLDHMLEQIGKHAAIDLAVTCVGDRHVDEHHTVEDVALALGQALRQALGDKRGIQRYGFVLPMDEASAEVAIDLGGRPYVVFEGAFPRPAVGALSTELVPHFFRSLADTLGAAIQIRVRGENTHHMVEACFKGFARALRQAVAREGRDLPTTKGVL